jgi:PE family
LAAAQDEVSAAISALFGSYGQEYQALGARVAAFHEQFVQALISGGNAYNSTEAANAAGVGVIFIDATTGTVTTVESVAGAVKTAEETLVHDVETQVATDERIILSLKKEGE